MRKARLLSTVAATLLLTVGVAAAQNTNMKKDEAPTQAPAAQQKAPAEKVAPAMKPGEQKAGVQQKAPETTGQAPKASDADKPRASDKGAMDKDSGKLSSDKKSSSDANGGTAMKPKAGDNAQAPAGAKSGQATTSEKPATTGQGAAAGSAKLTPEQHSKITTIIRSHKVEPAHLNVSVSVGTRVPDSVRFYPLPSEVYVIYPEWRGYDYIVVGDQILVIDPRSHEIVAVLDA